MKQSLSRFKATRLFYAAIAALVILLILCGVSAITAGAETNAPLTLIETSEELYPADVQIVSDGEIRQIIKTYILTEGQNPKAIPRDNFVRDGKNYTLTDITENKAVAIDTRAHREIVVINTSTSELNEVLKQLSPTIEYMSNDGYSGLLTLDLSSVKCEAEGYKNSSYTISATREYPHMSANDLSLIPKTINENGRNLQLDDVRWEAQNLSNIDYVDIPDSYRAIARYTASATRSVVTGYITTAEYSGEITKEIIGGTAYIAYFSESAKKPISMQPFSLLFPVIAACLLALALLFVAATFFFPRYNVKVFSARDGKQELIAKDRLSQKNPTINLTPLSKHTDDECFRLEIEKFTAKKLNGKQITITFNSKALQHIISYEGNYYTLEADFGENSIKAIYC